MCMGVKVPKLEYPITSRMIKSSNEYDHNCFPMYKEEMTVLEEKDLRMIKELEQEVSRNILKGSHISYIFMWASI